VALSSHVTVHRNRPGAPAPPSRDENGAAAWSTSASQWCRGARYRNLTLEPQAPESAAASADPKFFGYEAPPGGVVVPCRREERDGSFCRTVRRSRCAQGLGGATNSRTAPLVLRMRFRPLIFGIVTFANKGAPRVRKRHGFIQNCDWRSQNRFSSRSWSGQATFRRRFGWLAQGQPMRDARCAPVRQPTAASTVQRVMGELGVGQLLGVIER
jgi:hypothetical protein